MYAFDYNAVGGGWGWFVELGSTDCLHSFDNHHRIYTSTEKKKHTHTRALFNTCCTTLVGGLGLLCLQSHNCWKEQFCGCNNSD